MKFLIFTTILLTSLNLKAQTRVLNFNTMCDICSGANLASFSKRLVKIRDIIHSYEPDLVSLQELRQKDHLEFLFAKKSNFKLIHHSGYINYTDSAIAINTDQFTIINSGHFWLGPNPDTINTGWKVALPRIAVWAHLKNKQTNKELIFMSSHFDNRIENLNESAKLIANFAKNKIVPIIFAADTNITTDMPAFTKLQRYFKDTYTNYSANSEHENSELCYSRKGDVFPACKVEHILISKNSPWKATKTTINLVRSKLGPLSDHRIFVVDLF